VSLAFAPAVAATWKSGWTVLDMVFLAYNRWRCVNTSSRRFASRVTSSDDLSAVIPSSLLQLPSKPGHPMYTWHMDTQCTPGIWTPNVHLACGHPMYTWHMDTQCTPGIWTPNGSFPLLASSPFATRITAYACVSQSPVNEQWHATSYRYLLKLSTLPHPATS
jgi:hypothetical protein